MYACRHDARIPEFAAAARERGSEIVLMGGVDRARLK